MICPKCNGRGTVGYYDTDHFVDIECDRCNESGEVEMTNEEWFCSLDTEQKAEWLQEHMDCVGCPATQEKCHRYYDACKEVMMEWLKQPKE